MASATENDLGHAAAGEGRTEAGRGWGRRTSVELMGIANLRGVRIPLALLQRTQGC